MLLGFGLNFSFVQWGIPFVVYEGRERSEITENLNNMSLIADLKKERLSRWLEERRDDIKVIASSLKLSADYNSLLKEIRMRQSAGELDSMDWKAISKLTGYKNLEKYFKEIIQAYNVYTRISIVDVESGLIQVSANQDELGDVEFLFKITLGRMVTRRAGIAPVKADRRSGEPIIQLYKLIGYPTQGSSDDLSRKGLGILIFDVSITDIIGPMLHTGKDLGETGEVVLINSDRKILAHLKFSLTDGTLAEPLVHTIDSLPAKLAARGEEGIIESIDYRGVKVFAAYRHIIVSNDFGWGMVVKRDKRDIFADLRSDNKHSVIVGLSLLVVLFIVIYIVTLSSFNPLKRLVKATEQVAQGDFKIELPITGGQEVEKLSSAFNFMAGKLESVQKELLRKQAAAALRVSEERLRTITENSSDHIMLIGKDLNILFINKTNSDMKREDVLGKNINEFIPKNYQEFTYEKIQSVFETGKPTSYETEYLTPEGDTQYHDFRLSPVVKEGRVVSVVSNSNNITAHIMMQEKLAQNEKLATIGKLAAGVAHQINNPLGCIVSYSELLLRKVEEESESFEDISGIKEEALRAGRIVSDLLSFSRERKLNKSENNINDLIENFITRMKKLNHDFRCKIEGDLTADIPIFSFDKDQIIEVVENLIENAIHATPTEGKINISTSYNKGSKMAEINIKDEGCGIADNVLNKIFDPFFTTKKTEGGAGLGLSIVHGIISSHGGNITVQSRVGEGTLFSIQLPVNES